VRALCALHSHSHYWLCYLGNTRLTATQFWYTINHYQLHSVGLHSPIIFFLFFMIHIFPARFISSLDLNPSEHPIIRLIKIIFNFDCGGNRSARRKPAVRDPFIRCHLSSAASWDRTHTPHRHLLQACKSDTSDALNRSATMYPQFTEFSQTIQKLNLWSSKT
jgi:hypothetical protein